MASPPAEYIVFLIHRFSLSWAVCFHNLRLKRLLPCPLQGHRSFAEWNLRFYVSMWDIRFCLLTLSIMRPFYSWMHFPQRQKVLEVYQCIFISLKQKTQRMPYSSSSYHVWLRASPPHCSDIVWYSFPDCCGNQLLKCPWQRPSGLTRITGAVLKDEPAHSKKNIKWADQGYARPVGECSNPPIHVIHDTMALD